MASAGRNKRQLIHTVQSPLVWSGTIKTDDGRKRCDPMTDTPVPGAAKRDYLPAERRDMILSLLTQQSVVTVPELAKLLNTTAITVRRDLTALANAGLVKRVRGGAMSVGEAPERAAGQPAMGLGGVVTGHTAAGVPTVRPVTHQPELSPDQPAIGVMLPEPSFFWPGVTGHMRDYAARLGMRLVTRECAYEGATREDLILQSFADDPTVCGIIAAPTASASADHNAWDWIERTALPTVVIERDQPTLGTCYVDSVRTNHQYGVRKAAVHFLAHGHHRIGAAFNLSPTAAQIQDGWRQVVDASDAIDCPFVFDGIQPYDTKGVGGIVDKILLSGVTAMLVHSDYLAIAIAQELERRGRRVPQDLSMISVDGFATPSSRPLTVLRSPEQDLAQAAVSMLVTRLQDPAAATRHLFVDPALIDRGSVVDVTPA